MKLLPSRDFYRAFSERSRIIEIITMLCCKVSLLTKQSTGTTSKKNEGDRAIWCNVLQELPLLKNLPGCVPGWCNYSIRDDFDFYYARMEKISTFRTWYTTKDFMYSKMPRELIEKTK